ncbi:MAG: hypothetical protein HY226_05705 [Candidatus Vogelbacteria bacterium]|nr:hypothetical protein [Candidatus Vogelbacteria bacterium]
MPEIHKPPIGLSIEELVAIETWLFVREGITPPTPKEVRAAYEKFIPNEQSQTSGPPVSKDIYYGTNGIVSGPAAPKLSAKDYPRFNLPFPFNESRLIIWVVAQQHLYYGSLIFGGLFWIMILELASLVAKKKETALWCDLFAYQILQILIVVLSVAIILGVLLSIALWVLYPDLTKYLFATFRPFFMSYGLLFPVFSTMTYILYVTWKKTSGGFSKWFHASAGIVINLLGILAMMSANSWGSFMLSPAGVDSDGHFLGNYWHVLHNALWNPLNIYRFFSNLILSSAVMGAYTAFQAMSSKTVEKRAYYDWAGYLTLLATVISLLTVPFGGSWLLRTIWAYRQNMGMTLYGGLLDDTFDIRFILVGLMFFATNFYLWQRIQSINERMLYHRQMKYVFFVLTVSLLVSITPHFLTFTALEVKTNGGTHPVSTFGGESAKQIAINIMSAVTIWSLILWWRTKYTAKLNHIWMESILLGLFIAGGLNILGLGIYGYFVPFDFRVGLSLLMVITNLSLALFGGLLTLVRHSGAQKSISSSWGSLPFRGYFALFYVGVTVTWILGLVGYTRSSVRHFWHVMEIAENNSPWAFTHTIGFVANVITFNTLLFWIGMILILWLAKAGESSHFKT